MSEGKGFESDSARRVSVGVRRLAKRFGTVHAVRDVSLDVEAGEFMTLLGPSGSGKTTMLMMLVGFTDPTSGEIWIGGREVTHVQPHRRNIGVVFQNFALFPHMTVAENIAFPMRMRRYRERDIRVKIREALDLVRLTGLERRFPALCLLLIASASSTLNGRPA